jgi:hypothetical protein
MHWVYEKIELAARSRLEGREPLRYGEEFVKREASAKKLLGAFSRYAAKRVKTPKTRLDIPANGGFETFGH